MQVRIFHRELLFQCKVLLAAAADLEKSLTEIISDLMATAPVHDPPPRGPSESRTGEDIEASIRAIREWKADADRRLDVWQERDRRVRDEFWIALQQLVSAAGNISKLLWGQDTPDKQERREDSRAGLRSSISISDTETWVLKNRKLRNDWEHMDERLEEWWDVSAHRSIAIRNFGRVGGLGVKDQFLCFDLATRELSFWNNVAPVAAFVAEARALVPRLEKALK
ncbi:MAG: hypothetical protein M3O99_01325 [Chloroflexota bacterium]|nr:hypothetical protein [Chloroflexota bacterium]